MSNTIYWAALLDHENSNLLIKEFKPKHKKVFGEHVTLSFNPNEEQDAKWQSRIGDIIDITVIREAADAKGHAVMVSGIERDCGGISHITISCASGVRPYYSNSLLAKQSLSVKELNLKATIAKYTKSGWIKNG